MKLNKKIASLFLLLAGICHSQTPILNGNPGITNKVIFLDFDGQVVSGTSWNNGGTINAAASTVSSANKISIWKRICEDYRPFDVNVTTDSLRFNAATPTKRIRVIFTPTSAWYGSAGGVAYLGSFTWGGTPGTPCWVFENQLSYSAKNMSDAASHEVGHTLSLYHQSVYNASCVKTSEYHGGVSTGVVSWGPIMGAPYSRNVTIWHNGPNANGCTNYQYDHGSTSPGLTGVPYLSFLPDDIGNTFASAKVLNLTTLNQTDSALITTPTDVDLYKFTICNSRYVGLQVKPWALDTVNYNGANLDVKLKLYNSAGTLIASDSAQSRLHARVGMNLTAGTYFFSIKGDASAYHTGYGSLGKYFVSVKATNPPALANTILTSSNFCAGQNVVLNYTSNGVPNAWQWTITGPSSATFATQNPTFGFSPAGIYTISLLATGSTSTSCAVTKTIDAGSVPALAITGTAMVCPAKSATLTASGAISYTWMPGNFNGPTQVLTPQSNTTYTVTGTNGNCTGNILTTVTVIPAFNLNVTPSGTVLCAGQSVTLNVSGVNSFTIFPGGVSVNPAVFTPTYNTNYFTTGSVGQCNKTVSSLITVLPDFALNVLVPDTVICAGQTITLIGLGAANYTLYPGGTSGNVWPLSPGISTTYTIVADNNGNCSKDTLVNMTVVLCTPDGIKEVNGVADISIYPNPASGVLHIETNLSLCNVEISNAIGSVIFSGEISDSKNVTINTMQWAKGVYFVKLKASGKQLTVKKILME